MSYTPAAEQCATVALSNDVYLDTFPTIASAHQGISS